MAEVRVCVDNSDVVLIFSGKFWMKWKDVKDVVGLPGFCNGAQTADWFKYG